MGELPGQSDPPGKTPQGMVYGEQVFGRYLGRAYVCDCAVVLVDPGRQHTGKPSEPCPECGATPRARHILSSGQLLADLMKGV